MHFYTRCMLLGCLIQTILLFNLRNEPVLFIREGFDRIPYCPRHQDDLQHCAFKAGLSHREVTELEVRLRTEVCRTNRCCLCNYKIMWPDLVRHECFMLSTSYLYTLCRVRIDSKGDQVFYMGAMSLLVCSRAFLPAKVVNVLKFDKYHSICLT